MKSSLSKLYPMLQVVNALLVAKCHFQFRSKTSSFKISTVFFKNEKSVNCKLDARYENYLTLFLFFFKLSWSN